MRKTDEMSLPGPLRTEQVGQLAAELGSSNGHVDRSPSGPRRTGGRWLNPKWAVRQVQRAKRALRRAAGEGVRTAIQRATAPGVDSGITFMRRLDELDRGVGDIRHDAATWERERDELQVGLVNLELLKGEVRGVGEVLEQLARAIAPAFGLSEAATALADLRERVTFCERRLRYLETALSAGPTIGAGESSLPPAPPAAARAAAAPAETVASPGGVDSAPSSTRFDYAGFERRFRGRPEDVVAMLDERYGRLLAAHPPVLDIGCGRAELIELLSRRGVEAMGVDTDPSLVADARERGLDVVRADAIDFLRERQPQSFGAIVATHVLEHLPLEPLIELLELSQSRLRPGGVFVAETPNPASLIVLGNAYILDPTHVRPLHPKLLEFLCESAGFRNLEVKFFSPATGFQLELISDHEAPALTSQVNQAIEQLNSVLFGPQDYAIIAVAGDAKSALAAKEGVEP